MVGGEILAKMTPPYNLTGKDFEKVGITFASSGNGWQKGTKSSRFGRIVNSIGGSSSTYTCDYFGGTPELLRSPLSAVAVALASTAVRITWI